MKVLEEKEEKIAPGTLLGTTHTYAIFLFYIILFLVVFFIYLIDFMSLNFFLSTFVPTDMWLTLAPKTKQLPKG